MRSLGKNMLKLDTSAFEAYAERLDRLGANLKPIFTKALEQAADKITQDTQEAMQNQNLPAGGKYHHAGNPTERSILEHPKVKWSGMIGEMGVGFDFSKHGAGGYLITGTPRMAPDRELNKIYKSKRYMSEIKKGMRNVFEDAIQDYMGG